MSAFASVLLAEGAWALHWAQGDHVWVVGLAGFCLLWALISRSRG